MFFGQKRWVNCFKRINSKMMHVRNLKQCRIFGLRSKYDLQRWLVEAMFCADYTFIHPRNHYRLTNNTGGIGSFLHHFKTCVYTSMHKVASTESVSWLVQTTVLHSPASLGGGVCYITCSVCLPRTHDLFRGPHKCFDFFTNWGGRSI